MNGFKGTILCRWNQLKLFDQSMVCFFLGLNGLILLFHQNLPYWGWHLAKHFMICFLIVVLVPYLQSQNGPAAHFIRHWYPAASIPFIYWNMDFFIHLIFPGEFDAIIISIETKVFGVLPNILVQKTVTPFLTETMQLFYALYWLTIPSGAAILYFVKSYEQYDYFLHYILLTFFISCFAFILFPVIGPRLFMADQIPVEYQGIFLTPFLRHFVENAGLRGCAFPSAHVGIAIVVMFFMWAVYPRLAKWVFLPAVTGLSLATVYGQYHYLTDVMGGMVIGIVMGYKGIKRMKDSVHSVTQHSPTGKRHERRSENLGRIRLNDLS